ncbi:MAG: hypothetical protein LEGION0398_MBIBDBAK_00861 [Legionellaceae bacterium]
MKVNQLFLLANKLLFRNWRSGGLGPILLLCTIMISLSSSLSWYSDGIKKGINNQAAELYGGDYIIKSTSPLSHSLLTQAAHHFSRTAQIIYINNVLETKNPNNPFEPIQIKAVSKNYPLYGKLRVSSLINPEKAVFITSSPTPGTVWIDAEAVKGWHLSLGDSITIGVNSFRISRLLYQEPDDQLNQFKLAPRIILSIEDLPATKILGKRSKADFILLAAGNNDSYIAKLKTQLMPNQSIISAQEGRLDLKSGFDQLINYIKIAILSILVLAGSVVNIGLQEYNSRNNIFIGILRTLGLTQKNLSLLLFFQFSTLILIAGLIGLPCGYFMQKLWLILLQDLIPEALPNTINPTNWLPGLKSIVFCAIFLFIYSMQHWIRLSRVSPMRVLRDNGQYTNGIPSLFYVIKYTLLFAIFYLYTLDIKLIIGGLAILGILSLLVNIISYGIGISLKKIHSYLPHTLQIVALNTARNILKRRIQILSFTLVSFVACLSYFSYDSLLNNWEKQVPVNTPNYFLFNISPKQSVEIKKFLTKQPIPIMHEYPIFRGRLIKHNGQDIKINLTKKNIHSNVLNREINLTTTNTLPQNNHMINGNWWTSKDTHRKDVSIEAGLATYLGIKMGDNLTFQMGDQELNTKVKSIRTVTWSNLQPNFYMIFPQESLNQYPYSVLMSIHLAKKQELLLKHLREHFPDISIISINDVVEQATGFFKKLSSLSAWIFLYVIITGIIAQYLILWATQKERQFENALLKALGVTNNTLIKMDLLEHSIYALLASTIGIFFSYTTLKFALIHFLNISIHFNVFAMLNISLISLTIILLSAIINNKKNLQVSPLKLLRG